MIKLASHKRGDTFAFIATMRDSTNNLMPGILDKLRCQIRDQNKKLIYEVIITESDPGDYVFKVPASQTKLWPISNLYLDIEYTDNDVVTSSETLMFRVVEDITYEEEP